MILWALHKNILLIQPEALKIITENAFYKISHFYRSSHLKLLKKILEDKDASKNDHFVALTMLKNANISASGVLPMCQDTGTAIINGYRGKNIFTDFNEEKELSRGIYNSYQKNNLRFSQLAPISMFEEKNTNNNLPGEINLYAAEGDEYKFTFIQKGGGSANKSFLYQQTKAILNPKDLKKFLYEIIISLGTAACPPYHLAIVIGGTSAELNLKTVKLASTKYLDELPIRGDEKTGHAFRDKEWEEIILKMTQEMGIGAQFGGKYYCHDVRVIRLPRHGASMPVGIGVSCSADRQIFGKINSKGIFLEKLETNPAKYLPEIKESLDGTGKEIIQWSDVINDTTKGNEKVLEARLSDALLNTIPSGTQTTIYESYGMTETLTHVALRRRYPHPESLFSALNGIQFSSGDAGNLIIHPSHLKQRTVVTNDAVHLYSKTEFEYLGRLDHVINSGGVKLFPESIEQKLSQIVQTPFFVTALPHPALGEQVGLILEGDETLKTKVLIELNGIEWGAYEKPKRVEAIPSFDYTATNKIDRLKTLKRLDL